MRIRVVLVVLSMIWLVAVFVFLIGTDDGFGQFILHYAMFGLIPIIVVNGCGGFSLNDIRGDAAARFARTELAGS